MLNEFSEMLKLLDIPTITNPLQNPLQLTLPQQEFSLLGTGGGVKDTLASGGLGASTTFNPTLTAALFALGAGSSLLGGERSVPPQAPARSTGGRGFPWQNTQLYQQANMIPNANFNSLLARLLRG